MKMKRILTVLLAALLLVSAAGCTTLGLNTGRYFSQISDRLDTLSRDEAPSPSPAAEDGRTALAAPAGFTVDDEGNYSFEAVENAESYIIYLYRGDNESYDYVTRSITGEGTITGSVAGLNYPYGDYRVSVVAYPSYTSTEYRSSEETFASLKKTGPVAEPELTFFWDCFARQLNVIWTNASAYSSTGYPVSMDVTLSGSGAAPQTVAMNAGTNSYPLENAEAGKSYEVSAVVSFDENYVTNPTVQVDLGSVVCEEQRNFAPEGYEYNSGLYSYADYPIAAYDFDMTAGGEIGRWKIYSAWGRMGGASGGASGNSSSSSPTYLVYTAVPAETEAGDLATFTFTAGYDDGSNVVSTNFGSLKELTGRLHMHEDGTFLMVMDAIYICTDQISGMKQYHNGSSIEGIWYENENGLADLSFNMGSEVNLGHE